MRKLLKWVISRFFNINEPFTMAMAGSIGIFIGMLPLTGMKLPIIVLISLIFQINIISLLMGLLVTIIIPLLSMMILASFQYISGHEVNHLRHGKFSIVYFLQWMNAGKYHLVGTIIVGLIFAIIAFPFFKWFYSRKRKNVLEGNLKKSIFYDNSGNRWGTIKQFSFLLGIIFIFITSIFAFSITQDPVLPKSSGLESEGIKSHAHISSIPLGLKNKVESHLINQEKKTNDTFQLDFSKHNNITSNKKIDNKKVFAFYVDWDENSLSSLKSNIKKINVVIPNWYVLNSDGSIKNNSKSSVDDIIKSNNASNMPLINNYVNGDWNGQLAHKIFTDKKLKSNTINYLTKDIKEHGYSGINIDFESIDAKDKDAMTEFIKEISEKFHSNNLKISMDVPASNDAFDYKELSKLCDYMMVMIYDEHDDTGDAGPIASNNWFESILTSIDIPKDKLIVGIGSYGYDWNLSKKGLADSLSFGDVMGKVNDYGIDINWDTKSGNAYTSYTDNNEKHEIWLLDAATTYNELKIAEKNGMCGTALWRLGSEDPGIWKIIRDSNSLNNDVNKIEQVSNNFNASYYGEGELLRVTSKGTKGQRTFKLDSNGDMNIIDETYDKYPTSYEVKRFGKPKSKEVVLTFDDGPDPEYTPKILDILKKYHVNASFFIVGENGEANPDIVKREYNEGNEIGNHTFTHPNVAKVSESRTKMELNTTQRFVQEVTGHSTMIFRPPYVADAEPTTSEEIEPIIRAQREGYTMVGELIDPTDWERPSSDVIVKRIMEQLPNGNVILLHDAGGNRENTVKALPVIIETLRNKGYKFVTIHDLIGEKRDAVMPSVKSSDNIFLIYDKAFFSVLLSWQIGIKTLFYLAIILGIIRFMFLVFFSHKQKRKSSKLEYNIEYNPFVSVVIAAYNEEKVICKTIESILESDYNNFEIIIVNDGSTDNTAGVITENFKDNTNIRLINKINTGKSSSVNVGFKEAKGEIVVALDADTLIAKNAITLLICHFTDENIAAVSGNVKVGNVHNLLTLWQHVEYVTGFNLERRAFAELNCITVVPGAIGAWRMEAVKRAGYFKEDTLAEDTDITMTLLRMGYKIAFEEFAYAYTESPSNLKSLLKQRYRWTYGTLQCLWKHREALFNPEQKSLGFIALPNMWLFQYVFLSLSPIVDIYFIMGLFGKATTRVIVYYFVFLFVDYIASIYAFNCEKESKKPLILLFLQRVIYRLLMTYAVLKSIFSALKGITVGWNKLQRRGDVKQS